MTLTNYKYVIAPIGILSIVVFTAVTGHIRLWKLVQNLKANEPLTSVRVQARSHAAFGRVIVWKAFTRNPISEHVIRFLSTASAAVLFPYVSADQVSILALLVALSTFPFLKSKNVWHRWIGFCILLLREFLDCLDGDLARATRAKLLHLPFLTSSPSSHVSSSSPSSSSAPGYAYYLDGLCDSTFIFVFLYLCYLKWGTAMRTAGKDGRKGDDGDEDVGGCGVVSGRVGDGPNGTIHAGMNWAESSHETRSTHSAIADGFEANAAVEASNDDDDCDEDGDDDDDEGCPLAKRDLGDPKTEKEGENASSAAEQPIVVDGVSVGRLGPGRRRRSRRLVWWRRLRRRFHLFPPRNWRLAVILEYFVTFMMQSYCYNKSIGAYPRLFERMSAAEEAAMASGGRVASTTTSTTILQSKTFFVISHSWLLMDPCIIFIVAAFSLCVDKEFQFCRFSSRRLAIFSLIVFVISQIHLHQIDFRA